MNKVFLSHSSKDKEYVNYIAQYFGRDQCVYDSMCFETGMKNIDEIFREMDKTSIFTVFLSENSLQSEWVKKELSIADDRLNHDNQKLAQIFPIIIDPTINHTDERIPSFLKEGFGSYNLRVITSNQVAYRKIKAQQLKYLLDNHLCTSDDMDCFYGRESEIAHFKRAFDTGIGFNCFVASGLTGIGRKSYLLQSLKKAKIVENYYTPPIVSLDTMSSVEDLVVKLSEIGFGNYTLEDIASLPNMDAKIDALVDTLKSIQDCQELVLVYDNGALITRTGEVVFWFKKALSAIRSEVTLAIAARYKISNYELKYNPTVFFQELMALPYAEWTGLMRVYGRSLHMDLSQDDRNYFRDVLTGYPPQVRYCVELMKETSVQEVKKNTHLIVNAFSPKITEMLESSIPEEMRKDTYGLLAFMSSYGVVPTDLLISVIEINTNYKKVFSLLKNLTICRYLGVSNEYVEVNPVVSDYVQRNRFELPNRIKKVLNERLVAFNDIVAMEDKTKAEDFENIKYYLKANIIAGQEIPERFMYSTLYLSSIHELYNHQKYNQMISLVQKLKETCAFARYDLPVQIKIQEYYCRALARQTDSKFYDEVEFFKIDATKNIIEYNFLRGFMYRHNSEYGKALDRYKSVLEAQPHHRSAMREIVIVYRGLEDFESAYEYAKLNYLNDPENPFQIQPYFEMLIRKPANNTSPEEDKYIHEMLNTIKRINDTKPLSTYYEILGLYATYIEKDEDRAIGLLLAGMDKFPESSYIIRSLFDCSEFFRNISGMQDALKRMEPLSHDNKSIKVAYEIRTAIYYAHQIKPKDFIFNCINAINGFNDEAKERLRKKVLSIQMHNSRAAHKV